MVTSLIRITIDCYILSEGWLGSRNVSINKKKNVSTLLHNWDYTSVKVDVRPLGGIFMTVGLIYVMYVTLRLMQ